MTLVGKSPTLDVLIARKSTMALVATPLCRFRVSSSTMALMPKGVAAFPSPSMLAPMFMIMALIAGWSAGTSGKSRTMIGRSDRANARSTPASWATCIRPKNSAMVPTSPIARVTEAPAAASAA